MTQCVSPIQPCSISYDDCSSNPKIKLDHLKSVGGNRTFSRRVNCHDHAKGRAIGRRRFAMSRQDELLKLAELFYLQANLTRDRAAKQSLRKMGDCYQHEADQSRRQAPDSAIERPSNKYSLRHRAA